jgi:hypothetical protein
MVSEVLCLLWNTEYGNRTAIWGETCKVSFMIVMALSLSILISYGRLDVALEDGSLGIEYRGASSANHGCYGS